MVIVVALIMALIGKKTDTLTGWLKSLNIGMWLILKHHLSNLNYIISLLEHHNRQYIPISDAILPLPPPAVDQNELWCYSEHNFIFTNAKKSWVPANVFDGAQFDSQGLSTVYQQQKGPAWKCWKQAWRPGSDACYDERLRDEIYSAWRQAWTQAWTQA